MWPNLRRNFQFGPILKKLNQITVPGFKFKRYTDFVCFSEVLDLIENTFQGYPTFEVES